jgi:hypothetical protein
MAVKCGGWPEAHVRISSRSRGDVRHAPAQTNMGTMSVVLSILDEVRDKTKRNHSDDELMAIAKVAQRPVYNIMGRKIQYDPDPVTSKALTRADVDRYLQLVTGRDRAGWR